MEMKKGASRWVILTRRWAFKIPSCYCFGHFLMGMLKNMTERTVARLNPMPSQAFCPMVFSLPGGFLNVMVRADHAPWPGVSDEQYTAWKAEAGDFAIQNDFLSFGYLPSGKLVAIDYGANFEDE